MSPFKYKYEISKQVAKPWHLYAHKNMNYAGTELQNKLTCTEWEQGFKSIPYAAVGGL
jgi:hypothetical protein